MKSFKKFITAILICAVSTTALAFAACAPDNGEDGKHTDHTPAAGWEQSTTEHWHKCAEGGEEISGTRASHRDENHDGKCDDCNYTLSGGQQGETQSDLVFTLKGDNTYEVKAANTNISGEVEIPSTYGGKSVTGIAKDAFENCKAITSIKIPSTITSFGDGAFFACSGLTKLYITDLRTWCNYKFSDVSANPLNYAHNLYINNVLVTDLEIPEGVTSIGKYVFSNLHCSSIKIPASMTSMEASTFVRFGIEKFIVDEDNVSYSSKEGILYDKEKTKIIYVPANIKGTVTIPGTINKIERVAFFNCVNLEEVILEQGITSIGRGAFSDCTNLERITIPNSVSFIEDGAFGVYPGLSPSCGVKTIVYTGTKVQWNSMRREASMPSGVQIICTGDN